MNSLLYLTISIVSFNFKEFTMRKFIVPILFLFISIICFSLFHIIGSYTDSNGFLHEPFALLPIGYLFFVSGFIWLGGIFVRNLFLPITTTLIGIMCYGVYHWIGVGPFMFSSVGFLLSVTGIFWMMILILKKVKTKFLRNRIANS